MPSIHTRSGTGKYSGSEKSSLISGFDNQAFGRDYGATSGSIRDGETKATKDDQKKRTRAPVLSLYRYGTALDIFLLIVGILAAIITGAGMPVVSILFGDMTSSFLAAQTSPVNKKWIPPTIDPYSNWSLMFPNVTMPPSITQESFESNLFTFCVYNSILGAAVFVSAYLMTVCWCTVCERIMNRIRKEFFYAILRQEAAWFDVKQSGELTSRLSDDLDRIKEGIGDKMGLMFQNVAQFLTGYVVAFTRNWQLSLVMLAAMPLIVVFGGLLSKQISGASKLEQEKYAAAGGIAEEVISCIRTVVSFNGQKKEVARYGAALQNAKKLGIRKQLLTGLNVGVIMLVIFSSYALAFWFGAKLIVDGTIEKGQVFTVFMCVLFGSFALSTAAPQLGLLAVAQGAASAIYDIIDKRPEIDPYSRLGEKPKGCKGLIAFENVHFAYPTRPEIKIFNDLSFTVEPGNKVAFVGPSGCGKSTVINLLLRFYDPDSGNVTLDGINLKSLNLHWLRNTIGVVSQEPILFDATIAENIRYGRPDVTEKDMMKACKNANAHDFIMQLPQGYQTMVGERGTQLSGGQKQRIAIARSLVRDPKILLLDEATSALDAESESVVQEALEKAQEGRTTIIVAHRLSTIRNADKIIALQEGVIKEAGTHAELMKLQGIYYDLIMAQTFEDAGYVTGSAAEDDGDASAESDAVEAEIQRDSTSKEQSRRASKSLIRRQISKKSSTATPSRMSSKRRPSQRQLSRMMSKNPATVETDRIKEALKEEGIEHTSTFKEIAAAGKQEWPYLLIGFAGAAIRGVVMPLFSYVYSEIFSVYSMEGQPLLDAASNRCLWFVGIGIVQAVGVIMNMHFLGMSGENFVMRLRLKVFENILRMDGAYFDEEKHGTGKLCTRLSSDAPNVKSAIDYRTSSVLVSAISMIAGLVMGIIFGWQMALMVIGMLPVLGLASFINMRLRTGTAMRDTELLENAGKTAAESIENVKTVQYLTREMTFYQAFCHHLVLPYKTQLRNAHIHAFGYAFANACFYFIYAAAFRFGGFMVIKGDMDPVSVFRVFNCVVFASMTIGGATAFFGEFAKARLSGALIFKMINERPKIDSYSSHGLKPNVKGDIKFSDVFFRYPTRPDIEILKDFSVEVESGKSLALVGQSGCGKSTTVSLIERFYDPWGGNVIVDDFDLKTINIKHLRDQISIVSQEPVLFDCSIRDNIAYGVEEGVSHEAVTSAAKQANIHDFILSLPEGYNTRVGEKGTQLSGGQKQRVAIARALIRRPKILLLDEATSALDTESEKIVQEALDRARQGRTCIIIAHRLSTVQSADTIAVIKGGKVVEKGTHQELISKHGVYFELTKKQTIEASKY